MFWPFTEEALAAYEAAFRDRKPTAPDEAAFKAAPQPCSFALCVTSTGLCVRFASADGAIVDMGLNPYLARTLALFTLEEGERAGWLDEDANFVTCPTYNA